MQSHEIHIDSIGMVVCNEFFDAICNSGLTKLKQKSRLSSLLNLKEEEDARTRQRLEVLMDEIRMVITCTYTFVVVYVYVYNTCTFTVVCVYISS